MYRPYRHLLQKDSEKFVDKFISKERSLPEYVREIEKLKKMTSNLASLPVLVPMHFFLLDCQKINQVPCEF